MVAELELNSVNPSPDTIEEVRNSANNTSRQSLNHIIQQTCDDNEGLPKRSNVKKWSIEFKTR